VRLPAAIAEWEHLFELLPEDVRSAVVGLAMRLAPAIGPFPPTEAAPGHDVDGFTGLARRGPYERLLLSEWALASAVPMEFLRRAAEKEHLFYELSRKGAAPRRRSLAIFDGGPDQLGGPRVVHLALVLLLGARARRAGADFWWAVAQAERPTWVRQIDELTLPALFHARSTRPLTREHLDRLLALEGADAEDLWVVGTGKLAPAIAHRVIVDDLLDDVPGTRRVSVRVLPHGRIERRVELALPPLPIAARIVSEPFRRPALVDARPVLPGRATGLGFAATAARAFGYARQAYFTASVPSPGGGCQAQVSSHDATDGVRTLGLQIHAGSLWALVHVPGRDEIVLRQYPRERPKFTAEVHYALRGRTLPETDSPGQLFVRTVRHQQEWVLHLGDELWMLRGNAERIATGVLAVAPGRKDQAQLTAVVDAATAAELGSTLAERWISLVHDGGEGRLAAAWLGRAEYRVGDRFIRVAAGMGAHHAWVEGGPTLRRDGHESVLRSNGLRIDLPAGSLPIGVWSEHRKPRLLALSRDRRRLEGHGSSVLAKVPTLLHRSEIPLVAGAVSLCRPEAAVLDESGELTFLSLGARGRVLAKIRPAGAGR
jgi:hypothetical protein